MISCMIECAYVCAYIQANKVSCKSDFTADHAYGEFMRVDLHGMDVCMSACMSMNM